MSHKQWGEICQHAKVWVWCLKRVIIARESDILLTFFGCWVSVTRRNQEANVVRSAWVWVWVTLTKLGVSRNECQWWWVPVSNELHLFEYRFLMNFARGELVRIGLSLLLLSQSVSRICRACMKYSAFIAKSMWWCSSLAHDDDIDLPKRSWPNWFFVVVGNVSQVVAKKVQPVFVGVKFCDVISVHLNCGMPKDQKAKKRQSEIIARQCRVHRVK